MLSIAALEKKFAHPSLKFSEAAPAYPLVSVTNKFATATIALHGAHLTAYQPKDEKPVIWTSATAIYKEGKAIRGGIPVCWPWFGDAKSEALPAHGFARNRFWGLQSVEALEDDSTTLIFCSRDDESTRQLWPYAFSLSMEINVGACLSLRLKSSNTGDQTFFITNALHSYFSIYDVEALRLSGLDGTQYKDKLNDDELFLQEGELYINAELDRVYQNTHASVLIHDLGNRRRIRVEKAGSQSTVVWNPWIEKSASMADFEAMGFRQMVCVEAANVGDAAIDLAPGETQVLETRVSVEAE